MHNSLFDWNMKTMGFLLLTCVATTVVKRNALEWKKIRQRQQVFLSLRLLQVWLRENGKKTMTYVLRGMNWDHRFSVELRSRFVHTCGLSAPFCKQNREHFAHPFSTFKQKWLCCREWPENKLFSAFYLISTDFLTGLVSTGPVAYRVQQANSGNPGLFTSQIPHKNLTFFKPLHPEFGSYQSDATILDLRRNRGDVIKGEDNCFHSFNPQKGWNLRSSDVHSHRQDLAFDWHLGIKPQH